MYQSSDGDGVMKYLSFDTIIHIVVLSSYAFTSRCISTQDHSTAPSKDLYHSRPGYALPSLALSFSIYIDSVCLAIH